MDKTQTKNLILERMTRGVKWENTPKVKRAVGWICYYLRHARFMCDELADHCVIISDRRLGAIGEANALIRTE